MSQQPQRPVHIIQPKLGSVFVNVDKEFYQAPINVDGTWPQWPEDKESFSGEITEDTAGDTTILILKAVFAWVDFLE